jgi:hypothetical protein
MSVFAEHDSEIREVETYEFPLAIEDDNEIKRMLREREVFAPSFIPQDDDVYDPLMYRRQSLHHQTNAILLADRNVITRWLALVTGAKALSEHRIPAAILAFAQSSNMLVEPSLALYEAAATTGTDAANDELRLFRIADNINTHHWANLALERTQRLPLSEIALPTLPNGSEQIDFSMPLRRWRRNYIILLKLAELELRGMDRTKQITELTRWMYEDFIIGGPALIFAIHYLAPNSARSGLLKSLHSIDRERALWGIRNASWDLTLLSDWLVRISRQKAENTLTLLCSLDRKLMRLANMIAPQSNDESSMESFLRSSFLKILQPWGSKASRELSELLEGFLTNTDNPTRQLYRPEEVNIDVLITAGEKLVRDWKIP